MDRAQFRPCIDLHEGKVKQIVGGSLSDGGEGPRTNFVSVRPPDYYAAMYRRDGLTGGHVIKLGPGNDEAALCALRAWPGGLQLGGNFRHGAATGTHKMDLSLAPRVMLGWNLGRVVELHAGGFAGIAAQRFDESKSQLVFSCGGFGGLRLNVSESFALVAEGYYAYPTKYLHVPYGSAGIAIKF